MCTSSVYKVKVCTASVQSLACWCRAATTSLEQVPAYFCCKLILLHISCLQTYRSNSAKSSELGVMVEQQMLHVIKDVMENMWLV